MSGTHERWRDLAPAHRAQFATRPLGTDLADADQSIRVTDGTERILRSLTADRTITLLPDGAELGQPWRLVRKTSATYVVTVRDQLSDTVLDIFDAGIGGSMSLVFTTSGWLIDGRSAF